MKMKAAVATARGTSDVLQLMEVDQHWPAGDGDVLVRVKAAALNPADIFFRQLGGYLDSGGPLILGHDGAGIVESVGPGVTLVKAGDRVCFCHGGIGGAPGTYAEFAVVPQALLAVIPDAVDYATAAALPLVYITLAESLYDRAKVQAGEHVLIHAGAGGTGHIGIQLAKLRGAHVATTVSNPDKAEMVRGFGADLAILYREQDFVDAARNWSGGAGVDVAFDNVGAETMLRSLKAMAPYGRVVTLMGTPGDTPDTDAYNQNLSIHNVMMLTPMWLGLEARLRAQASHIRQGLDLVAAGKLRIVIDRVFDLREISAAHDHLESGAAIGKVVINV